MLSIVSFLTLSCSPLIFLFQYLVVLLWFPETNLQRACRAPRVLNNSRSRSQLDASDLVTSVSQYHFSWSGFRRVRPSKYSVRAKIEIGLGGGNLTCT